MSHIAQSQHSTSSHNGSAIHVAPSQAANLRILRERPDVVAARISRKRAVRAAVLAAHGSVKVDFVASLLPDVGRSYVARCLSEGERAEFSEAHMARLGVLDIAAAQSEAA